MSKDVKTNATAKDKKKDGFFTRVGRWFKSLFTELKKVSWPKFPTVLKQTLVVLGVTIAFLLLVMGADALLGLAYNGFIGNL